MAELPELHSLLKRQLKRYAGAFDAESPALWGFIEDVSRAYSQFDGDRTMLERSLELSSQELLQANSEMRAIFQALPDLYFVLNEEGTILDCKGGSAADFLMPPNRLIGRKIQDVPQEDVRDVFVRALQLVHLTSKIIDFEYSISNGSVHYYEARLVPLPGTNMMAIIRNITGRKRAEADLEQSLSMLRATLESTADGILVVDNDGKIQSFNKKFVEMWNIPDSVLAKKDDNKALACVLEQLKEPDAFLQKVKELYAQPNSESYDMIEFKDGRMFERYSKPQTINGKSVGRVWSFRDTSDRRKLEEQLRHSHKMESVGTLAGGIAHDFNNILGIILGYASSLDRKAIDSPDVAQYLDAIIKASERGATLVRQMLTFARKTDVRFEPMNVNIVVRELEKMLQHTFPRTVIFDLTAAEQIPLVIADHNQIHQALLNLCVNAKDAMRGTGTISVCTEIVEGETLRPRFHGADADKYVALRVADTGYGMDETTRSRIFEPFFTTKAVGEGTGLGLAVVYGVVKSHRGFIDVKSEIGKGSTFSLYFPAAAQETTEKAKPDAETMEIPDGSETILVVEDEELLRNLLKTVFERKGYSVLTAQDGLEAIETYAQHKDEVSLVLTDIGLPKLDGRETYRTMKEINPNVKVILASGYLSPQLRASLLSEGAKDFIQKPYVPVEVLKKAYAVLAA